MQGERIGKLTETAPNIIYFGIIRSWQYFSFRLRLESLIQSCSKTIAFLHNLAKGSTQALP